MTNEQKQHLLAYLGYYRIKVDGIWGNGSVGATKKFQEDYGLEVTGAFDEKTQARIKEVIATGELPRPQVEESAPETTVDADFWDGIQHFNRGEFRCKCGKYCNGFPAEMDPELIRNAERVREHFESPCIVSSGVRCEKHNKAVGGVVTSRHLSGKAMDFCVRNFSATTVLAYVQSLPGIRYAYAIDRNYVHMDVE